MHILVFIITFLWELPQNILGIIVYLFSRHRISKPEIIHHRLFFLTKGFNICLGSFIFWFESIPEPSQKIPRIKAHEYGHSIQSFIFGPLYLILVGIPSFSRYIYSSFYYRFKKTGWENYYKGYPENWADKLGMKYF